MNTEPPTRDRTPNLTDTALCPWTDEAVAERRAGRDEAIQLLARAALRLAVSEPGRPLDVDPDGITERIGNAIRRLQRGALDEEPQWTGSDVQFAPVTGSSPVTDDERADRLLRLAWTTLFAARLPEAADVAELAQQLRSEVRTHNSDAIGSVWRVPTAAGPS